jgi:hypothetical protein
LVAARYPIYAHQRDYFFAAVSVPRSMAAVATAE